MNGSEALKIAQAALRFVAADDRRKRLRDVYETAVREHGQAGTLEIDGEDGRIIGPEDVVEARQDFRSAAASVAGYRRGLAKACQPSLLSGVPSKGLAKARGDYARA